MARPVAAATASSVVNSAALGNRQVSFRPPPSTTNEPEADRIVNSPNHRPPQAMPARAMSPKLVRPSPGEPAPMVTLLAESGHRWRLEDQRGSTTVLIFHRHIH